MNEVVRRELERLRPIWEEGGNLSAVFDALSWCRHFEMPLPEWIYSALGEVLGSYVRGDQSGKRWFREWRQDQADLSRHDAVEFTRERRQDWKSEDAGEELSATRFEFNGGGNDPIFKFAADQLARTEENVSPHTVRASWRKVKRRSKETPHRYYCGRLAMLFGSFDLCKKVRQRKP